MVPSIINSSVSTGSWDRGDVEVEEKDQVGATTSAEQDEAPKVKIYANAEDILPEEVWVQVLAIVDSQTVWACYKTCSLFQTVLEPKLENFLFPLVLPWVAENDPQNVNTLLSCRGVCHESKRVVDAFWENKLDLYDFVTTGEISDFLLRMKSYTVTGADNPLITKKVTFSDTVYNDRLVYGGGRDDQLMWAEYWIAVGELLERFGKHVWHCSLEVWTLDLELFYLHVLVWLLSLMPELRTLTVKYKNEYFADRIWESRRKAGNLLFDELDELDDAVQANELPVLKHLKSLRFPQGPPCLMAQLFEGNCFASKELKELTIDSLYPWEESVEHDFSIESMEGRLKNLENLVLNLKIESLETLYTFQIGNWPLMELELSVVLRKDFGGQDDLSPISLRNLFTALNQFSGTLTKLRLHLCGNEKYSGGDIEDGKLLLLPLLRELQLSFSGLEIDSIDFLRNLSALAALSIRKISNSTDVATQGFSERSSSHQHQVIQFVGFLTLLPEPAQSNIWSLLPALRSLRLEDAGVHRVWSKSKANEVNFRLKKIQQQ